MSVPVALGGFFILCVVAKHYKWLNENQNPSGAEAKTEQPDWETWDLTDPLSVHQILGLWDEIEPKSFSQGPRYEAHLNLLEQAIRQKELKPAVLKTRGRTIGSRLNLSAGTEISRDELKRYFGTKEIHLPVFLCPEGRVRER